MNPNKLLTFFSKTWHLECDLVLRYAFRSSVLSCQGLDDVKMMNIPAVWRVTNCFVRLTSLWPKYLCYLLAWHSYQIKLSIFTSFLDNTKLHGSHLQGNVFHLLCVYDKQTCSLAYLKKSVLLTNNKFNKIWWLTRLSICW